MSEQVTIDDVIEMLQVYKDQALKLTPVNDSHHPAVRREYRLKLALEAARNALSAASEREMEASRCFEETRRKNKFLTEQAHGYRIRWQAIVRQLADRESENADLRNENANLREQLEANRVDDTPDWIPVENGPPMPQAGTNRVDDAPDWIPVTNEYLGTTKIVPRIHNGGTGDISRPVLVYVPATGLMHDAVYNHKLGMWVLQHGHGEVSHWMDLPEPPTSNCGETND